MANKRRPQGDGTIRKRNDGRWEARIIIGHKNDGSPMYISFDFDNPENAAQIDKLKLLNRGNICIRCADATITQIDEDELALRALREDKGYPRRGKR